MKVYTIAQQKGGVGKTALAADLTWHLAAAGVRVLAIDADPQHTLSERLGWTEDMEVPGFTSDVLGGDMSAQDAAIPSPSVPGVDLLVAEVGLGDLDEDAAVVRRWWEHLAEPQPWDAVVIDTAPNLKMGTLAAVVAADVLTVAAECAGESLSAMTEFVRQMMTPAEQVRPGRQIAHVVPMKYAQRESVSRNALADLTAAFGDRVTPPVRRSTTVPQAYDHGLPVSAYRPTSPVAQDFQAACAAITKH